MTGPARTRRARVPARRADAVRNEAAIVDAAMRVLAERPGASVAEIAEASGLGRATLYRHFRTRADLVQAILRHAVEAASAAIAGCDLDRYPAPIALERAIGALVEVGDVYRVLGREVSLDQRMLEREQRVALPLIETVRRGQRDGELRADLPAHWVLASMGNLLVLALQQIGAGALAPGDATGLITTTLLDGIAARG